MCPSLIVSLFRTRIAAILEGIHVSPAKQRDVLVPRKFDYRTDTDRQMDRWTDGQMDGQTDARQSDPYVI